MKIVCDACQAKYSISDDKVQGKVFKIRCKKCSNIIIVRGGADASPVVTAPAEPTDEAIWHVVVDQEQIGPLTALEIEQRLANGAIDSETYTWREGLADWLPLREIDVFASLGTKADPAERIPPVSVPARARDHAGSGELFAAAAAGSEVASAQKLRAARNESSVLFSLNNLAQIADSSHRSTSSASSVESAQATGAPVGEGSGLIDIRSMASAYMGGRGAATVHGKPVGSSTIGSIDDLPVFGGGGFSEPAVIVATPRAAPSQRLLFLMIGAVAILAVAAIVMIMLLLGREKSPKQVASPPAYTVIKRANEAPIARPTPAPVNTTIVETPKHTLPTPRQRAAKTADKKAPNAVGRVAPPPTQPVVPKRDAAACDEVSCVISGYQGACCERYHMPDHVAKPSVVKSDLPPSLDRAMITSGISAVKPRVMTCGDRSSAKGKVLVKVTVSAGGNVTNVAVESTPDPALGACAAAAVQKASFAGTQSGGSFRVPFSF